MIIGYILSKSGSVIGEIYLASVEASSGMGVVFGFAFVITSIVSLIVALIAAIKTIPLFFSAFLQTWWIYIYFLAFAIINFFIIISSREQSNAKRKIKYLIPFYLEEMLFLGIPIYFLIENTSYSIKKGGNFFETLITKISVFMASNLFAIIVAALSTIISLIIIAIISKSIIGSKNNFKGIGRVVVSLVLVAMITTSVISIKQSFNKKAATVEHEITTYMSEIHSLVEDSQKNDSYEKAVSELTKAEGLLKPHKKKYSEEYNYILEQLNKAEELNYIYSKNDNPTIYDIMPKYENINLMEYQNIDSVSNKDKIKELNDKISILRAFDDEGVICSITYKLNNNYNHLIGQTVNYYNNYNGYSTESFYNNEKILIYGDDVLLYSKNGFNSEGEITDFNLDISNVNTLRIDFFVNAYNYPDEGPTNAPFGIDNLYAYKDKK